MFLLGVAVNDNALFPLISHLNSQIRPRQAPADTDHVAPDNGQHGATATLPLDFTSSV